MINTEIIKICFFGIYDPTYSRNDILLAGLRQIGVEVVECRADWRDPKRYLKLWKSLRTLNNDYDYVYAAYPSPVPTILAKLISKKPVICDAFYSMYDSVVNDRRKKLFWHPTAIRLAFLDWLSVILADIVVTDTEAHKRYWSSWWFVDGKKIRTVYLGINDNLFYPMPLVSKDHILVQFHGSFIPLHGTDKIVEAAQLLAGDKKIHFRLIGSGRDLPKAKRLAEKYGLTNVEFMNDVPLIELNARISEADIVLGIFGDTAKARRVIPNKVYEGLVAKRPVITMDTPAIREIFSEDNILLVANDPDSIAEGMRTLAYDEKERTKFAVNGYNTVSGYSPASVAGSLTRTILDFY